LPQGLPKKIQFHLLLADLALQLTDAFARGRNIPHPHGRGHSVQLDRSWDLPWTTSRPQRFRSAAAELHAPPIQMTGRNLKFSGQLGCALPRDHPLDR
jgi:hypothetical protein